MLWGRRFQLGSQPKFQTVPGSLGGDLSNRPALTVAVSRKVDLPRDSEDL